MQFTVALVSWGKHSIPSCRLKTFSLGKKREDIAITIQAMTQWSQPTFRRRPVVVTWMGSNVFTWLQTPAILLIGLVFAQNLFCRRIWVSFTKVNHFTVSTITKRGKERISADVGWSTEPLSTLLKETQWVGDKLRSKPRSLNTHLTITTCFMAGDISTISFYFRNCTEMFGQSSDSLTVKKKASLWTTVSESLSAMCCRTKTEGSWREWIPKKNPT